MIMYQTTIGMYSIEGKNYTSFGIRCDAVSIEDISPDKRAVDSLVALCNSEELEPVHLYDIVEDFLASNQIPLQTV